MTTETGIAPPTRARIDAFTAGRTIGLAGASRGGRKFGNAVLRALRQRGYRVLPVHPAAATIDGEPAVARLADLPPVDGLVLVTPPAQTELLVRAAAEAGITRLWIQQGAESADALAYCAEHGLEVVHGECLLMYIAPHGFPHNVHRWVRGAFGRMPR